MIVFASQPLTFDLVSQAVAVGFGVGLGVILGSAIALWAVRKLGGTWP